MSGLVFPASRLVRFGGDDRPNPPEVACPSYLWIGHAPRVQGETTSVQWPGLYRASDVEWWERWQTYTGASKAAFTARAHEDFIRTLHANLRAQAA